MDCSTARLFLPFCRPDGTDLDGLEAAELDAHLAQCGECQAIAQTQLRLDDHLGQAMRDIEPPRGLRERILARLETSKPKPRRRWLGPVASGLAAAVVLLLLGGWYLFYPPLRQELSVKYAVNSINMIRPAHDESNAQLRLLGPPAGAPAFVNYAYLTGAPSLAILPGTQDDKFPVKVPQFIFGHGSHRAIIYRCFPAKVYLAGFRRQYRRLRLQNLGGTRRTVRLRLPRFAHGQQLELASHAARGLSLHSQTSSHTGVFRRRHSCI